MNLPILFVTAYVFVGGAFLAFLLRLAPDADQPGMATRIEVFFRATTLAVLWPATLALLALAAVFPPLGLWIRTGRFDGEGDR